MVETIIREGAGQAITPRGRKEVTNAFPDTKKNTSIFFSTARRADAFAIRRVSTLCPVRSLCSSLGVCRYKTRVQGACFGCTCFCVGSCVFGVRHCCTPRSFTDAVGRAAAGNIKSASGQSWGLEVVSSGRYARGRGWTACCSRA